MSKYMTMEAVPKRHKNGRNGLIGLAEHAAAHSGCCNAGPCAGGGFRLFVSLPINESAVIVRDVRHEASRIMIHVLLVEDQAIVRDALAVFLPSALATKPDGALRNIERPGSDGLIATATLPRTC
ncbi:MAG: hypothetical protein M3008_00660 [Chloroflexota bacterium]|nr:hypothetical protein [Chloroflexota bacterium]